VFGAALTRFVVDRGVGGAPARPDDRSASWSGRKAAAPSRRTLSASGRTSLAEGPSPHRDGRSPPSPANAASRWRPSLLSCNASLTFSRVLSVILTAERPFRFQPRQNSSCRCRFLLAQSSTEPVQQRCNVGCNVEQNFDSAGISRGSRPLARFSTSPFGF